MKKLNRQGFTIVEVMIVLAIAGLILAVVFIAVPALQRNQRNGARRNDVAYIKAQLVNAIAIQNNKLPPASNINLNGGELNYIGHDDQFNGVNPEYSSSAFQSGRATTDAHVTGGLSAGGGIYYLQDGKEIAAGEAVATHTLGVCNGAAGTVGPNTYTPGGTQPPTQPICSHSSLTTQGNWTPGYAYDAVDIGVNSVLILGGRQCPSSVIGVVTARTLGNVAGNRFPKSLNHNQAAIVYVLEGDDNLYCENI
ncbi:MAG: type II secretion system protein [Candidatus Saccharibacteria bacterium]|nr:type II secretion system protein [Candidatus Saccharibacteria bacterium]